MSILCKCTKHPKYQGKRHPPKPISAGGCRICWVLYLYKVLK